MCLHYYHVDVYNVTAEQIDIIDLTRTTGNDVNVIRYTSNYVFTLLPCRCLWWNSRTNWHYWPNQNNR